MAETVVLGGARTPFGKFGGALKDLPAVELGGIAIREALNRSKVPDDQVDEVNREGKVRDEFRSRDQQ